MLLSRLQEPDRKTWYPTIIGAGGDQECGQQARLYYSSMNASFGDRKFIGRDIVFFKPGEPGGNRLHANYCLVSRCAMHADHDKKECKGSLNVQDQSLQES